MTKFQRETLNKLASEKFDVGQQILKAVCQRSHRNQKAQAMVDRYIELEKKINAAIDNFCRV